MKMMIIKSSTCNESLYVNPFLNCIIMSGGETKASLSFHVTISAAFQQLLQFCNYGGSTPSNPFVTLFNLVVNTSSIPWEASSYSQSLDITPGLLYSKKR